MQQNKQENRCKERDGKHPCEDDIYGNCYYCGRNMLGHTPSTSSEPCPLGICDGSGVIEIKNEVVPGGYAYMGETIKCPCQEEDKTPEDEPR